MHLNKYLFDFIASSRLKQADYAAKLLVMILLYSFIPSLDKKLLIEMNQDMATIPLSVWTDRGYYFLTIMKTLEGLMIWAGARRFKDFLQQDHFTVQSLSFYSSVIWAFWYGDALYLPLLTLLLLTEIKIKKVVVSI
jgi:hypothetical protein